MADNEKTEENEEINEIIAPAENLIPVESDTLDDLPEPKTARLTYCAVAEMRPSPESKYAPMSVFGYFVMLLVTCLPVVGFIAAVITALVSKKIARRRLAAASAILHAVVFAALGAAYATAELAFRIDVISYLSSLFGG